MNKRVNLMLSLLFGGFAISSLSGCASNETQNEEKFSVKLTYDKAHGEVSIDKKEGKAGETVTLNITPFVGYEIKQVIINGVIAQSVGSQTFVTIAGENQVNVLFAFKTVDDYQVELDYNTNLGSVDYSIENNILNLNVTPFENVVIDSIKLNDNQIQIEEDNTYTLTLNEGLNFVFIDFRNTAMTVDSNKFTINLEYDEEKGVADVDKYEGNVGEQVLLSIEPYANYKVEGILFNNQLLEYNYNEKLLIKPIGGNNTIKINFGNGSLDYLEKLKKGAEYTDILFLGEKTDVTKEYFVEKASTLIKDGENGVNLSEFYDLIVADSDLRKSAFDKLFDSGIVENYLLYKEYLNLNISLAKDCLTRVFNSLGYLLSSASENDFSVLFTLFEYSKGNFYYDPAPDVPNPGPGLTTSNAQKFRENGYIEIANYIDEVNQADTESVPISYNYLVENKSTHILTSKFFYRTLRILLRKCENVNEFSNVLKILSYLFTPYQTVGSPGRNSNETDKEIKIALKQFFAALTAAFPNYESYNNILKAYFESNKKDKFINTNSSINFSESFIDFLKKVFAEGEAGYIGLRFLCETINKSDQQSFNNIILVLKDRPSSFAKAFISFSQLLNGALFESGNNAEIIKNSLTIVANCLFDTFWHRYTSYPLDDVYSNYASQNNEKNSLENDLNNENVTNINLYSSDVDFQDGLFEKIYNKASKIDINSANYDQLNDLENEIHTAFKTSYSYSTTKMYCISYNSKIEKNESLNLKIKAKKNNNESEIPFELVSFNNSKYGSHTAILKFDDLNYKINYTVYNPAFNIEPIGGFDYSSYDSVFDSYSYFGETSYFSKDSTWTYELLGNTESVDTSKIGSFFKVINLNNTYYFLSYVVFDENNVSLEQKPSFENSSLEDYIIHNMEPRLGYIPFYCVSNIDDTEYTWRFDRLDSIVNELTLDTTEVGWQNTTVDFYSIKDVDLKYYVCESVAKNYYLSNYDKGFYEYESMRIDSSRMRFFKNMELTIKDENGSILQGYYCLNDNIIQLTYRDFANKLDNSTCGLKTTTYTDENGGVYTFTYYVNELISSEKESRLFSSNVFWVGQEVNFPLDLNGSMFVYGKEAFYQLRNGFLERKIEIDDSKPDCRLSNFVSIKDSSNFDTSKEGLTSVVITFSGDNGNVDEEVYFKVKNFVYHESQGYYLIPRKLYDGEIYYEQTRYLVIDETMTDDSTIILGAYFNDWSVIDNTVYSGKFVTHKIVKFKDIKKYITEVNYQSEKYFVYFMNGEIITFYFDY